MNRAKTVITINPEKQKSQKPDETKLDNTGQNESHNSYNSKFISEMREITSEVSQKTAEYVVKLFSEKLSLSNVKYEPVVKPLLILDLNGFLIHREYAPKGEENQIPVDARKVNNFIVWLRPGLDSFLRYAFHNFNVAVWSSVKRHNIDSLVKYVFNGYLNQLIFIWDQNYCEKTTHPLTDKKPLFLKNLSQVWKTYPFFNEGNTLIIDDSSLKMEKNPGGCYIIVQEWMPKCKRSQQMDKFDDEYYDFDISKGLMLRLACYLTVPGRTMKL